MEVEKTTDIYGLALFWIWTVLLAAVYEAKEPKPNTPTAAGARRVKRKEN